MATSKAGAAYLQSLELARQKGPEAIRTLINLLSSEDERIQLAAANALLDRGYGKPQMSVDVAHSGTIAHEHRAVSATAQWLEELHAERPALPPAEPSPH